MELAKQYHAKLVNIKKEMHFLHEKTAHLKVCLQRFVLFNCVVREIYTIPINGVLGIYRCNYSVSQKKSLPAACSLLTFFDKRLRISNHIFYTLVIRSYLR